MAAGAQMRSDERRVFGFDRRTAGPALLVLGLAVAMSVVLPWIDSKTAYRDQVHEGNIVELADGITFVPATGWDLASGALVGEARSPIGSTATTELVDGSVTFDVQAAPFDGTPSALLARINMINGDLHHARGRAAGTTGSYQVTTRQGVVGVAEDFVSVARQGSLVAFVFDSRGKSTRPRGRSSGEGVEIVAAGPTGAMSRRRGDIVAMIRSIRVAS
jgi:ferric-dicitrate binding protein FerR (iron transport regulator)